MKWIVIVKNEFGISLKLYWGNWKIIEYIYLNEGWNVEDI